MKHIIPSQEEFSPSDPANPCVNYPTEEYHSYGECDDQFVSSSLPPDLKPFWAVDDISEAVSSFSLLTSVYDSLDWDDLFTGTRQFRK